MRKRMEKENQDLPSCEWDTELNLSLVPYWFLVALRIVITLLPQNGYIHPDEYFQSVEVVAGDVFDIETNRPWEFNTTFPIRSVALPYFVTGVPYSCLKFIAPFIKLWFDINIKTPYLMLVLPRLFVCLISFVTDYSLYRICYLYCQNYRARLLTLASSYVMLVYGTHTFSNTMEMALNSLLLYVVADCMRRSDQVIMQDDYLSDKYNAAGTPVERVKFYKMRSALPSHSFRSCLLVATITVIGIFNRPTFLAFAFPSVFFWLQRGLGSKAIGLGEFHLRIFTFMICGIPATAILIIIDSFYYGYLTMSEIIETKLSLDNFVVTPLNFLKYNVNSSNLSKHGLHPRYLHFMVNIPLLYNVLGIVGLIAFVNMLYRGVLRKWSELPRVQSIIGLMTLAFILPIFALSLFPHQEARFLIPVTLPVIFLHSQRIRHVFSTDEKSHENGTAFKFTFKSGRRDSILLTLWYLINILLTIFFGFLHQGGMYSLANHFAGELQSRPRLTTIHVVTSHLYSLPLFPLHLRNSKKSLFSKQTGRRYRLAKQFYSYELGSAALSEVHSKIQSLLESCELKKKEKRLDYRLYLSLPASLMEEFHLNAPNITGEFEYSVEKVFYPHVSTEALPDIFHLLSHECVDEDDGMYCDSENIYTSPLKFISRLVQSFGLTLIRIKR
ncbi:GPI mannosyltransferase 4 [Blattella germanica]|nr:GPI mannosyltransferase 4 [Blattella germanica]